MTQFKRGDDVKLTDNYAMALNRSPLARINWLGRRGIVKCSNSNTVSIIWDGTKAQQQVPARGVEKVPHAA
jgi:hypothetical protein